MRVLASALLILCLSLPAAHAAGTWRILKDHWSAADEKGFGQFVAAIGASNCSSSESCLRDPANPYRASDKHFVDIDVDCAKWPYLLRAYYAWKNGLPFSYVDAISGSGDNLRFTKTSNRAVGRRNLIDHGDGINGPAVIREMLDTVFSGTYRIDAAEHRGVLSDFYSPALDPQSIHSGTVIYDINGHVGIVYKVDGNGRIFYMDAHPDFTITRSVYGAQFGQSPLKLGGGLKNWRPLRLVGAHRDKHGRYFGGHIVFAENDQIPDFSLVQYVGTEPNPKRDVKQAKFVYNGEELGFYEYVRAAVSGGKMTYNPVYELKMTMKTLCNDLNDRAQYVNLAISDGIDRKPHPSSLPDDIFSSDDNIWESYATPARDARTRAAFAQFYKDMADMIDMWVHRDPRIVYDGYNLRKDLLKAYNAQSKACTITYLNSAKRPVAMTFDDLLHRVYAMSFDPYDCIELRWGASGDERDSCPESKTKLRWYEAERPLRELADRTGKAHTGFDLAELEHRAKRSDAADPPPVDVKTLIETMPYQVPLRAMRPVGR
ncbi:MAG: hypothetical protein KGJ53_10220 [Alphaproteobacteria bacterium]|nr:hypothetical protein [Alphaproteobacteria bacterium]